MGRKAETKAPPGRAGRLWLLAGEPRKTMGGRIERLRIAAGLTQTALAARACELAGIEGGLTKSFISLLEADRTQPAVRTLAGVAAALGCSMNYLFWGQERGPEAQAPEVRAEVVVEPPPPPPRRKPKVTLRVFRRGIGRPEEVQEVVLEDHAARRFLPATQEAGAVASNSEGAGQLPKDGRTPRSAGASLSPEGQNERG